MREVTRFRPHTKKANAKVGTFAWRTRLLVHRALRTKHHKYRSYTTTTARTAPTTNAYAHNVHADAVESPLLYR